MPSKNHKHIPASTVLVFDFDGTLIQSFETVIGIINRWVVRFGRKPITSLDGKVFRSEGAGSFFAKLGITRMVLPLMVRQIQKEQAKTIEAMRAVPGLFAAIRTLHRQGFRMGIVSSNSEDNIRRYLQAHGLDGLFEFVYAGRGLFDKDKDILQMLQEQQLSKEQIVYIGDEARDVTEAHQAGVRVIAVSWGFQHHDALAAAGPDWLVDSPREFLDLFETAWWSRVVVKLQAFRFSLK